MRVGLHLQLKPEAPASWPTFLELRGKRQARVLAPFLLASAEIINAIGLFDLDNEGKPPFEVFGDYDLNDEGGL